jgi:hypothetical protein
MFSSSNSTCSHCETAHPGLQLEGLQPLVVKRMIIGECLIIGYKRSTSDLGSQTHRTSKVYRQKLHFSARNISVKIIRFACSAKLLQPLLDVSDSTYMSYVYFLSFSLLDPSMVNYILLSNTLLCFVFTQLLMNI